MKCYYCKKRNHLPFTCKWCSNVFCIKCVMGEIHNCEYIMVMKDNLNETLKTKLYNERTNDEKVVQI